MKYFMINRYKFQNKNKKTNSFSVFVKCLILFLSYFYEHRSGSLEVLAQETKHVEEQNSIEFSSFNTCNGSEVELFSCPLDSRRVLSLCLSKSTLDLVLRFDKSTQIDGSLPIEDPHQLISLGTSEASTIIRSGEKDSGITLYVDIGPGAAEGSGSAIVFPDKHAEFCENNKHRVDSKLIKLREGDVSLSIWDIQHYGITKEFGFKYLDARRRRAAERELWGSWPKKD